MKIKDGYMLRSVAGQNVVVPIGAAAVDFNGMISLNDSGALLWKILAQGATEAELKAALLETYDVDEARAEADVKAFVCRMKEANFLDE